MSKKTKNRTAKHGLERRTPPGAAPGTLIADPRALPPIVHLIAYGPDAIFEKKIEDVQEIGKYVGRWPVLWINVDGLGDIAVLLKLGNLFRLHRLALEDVINVYQRPKVEIYEEHCFIVARMTDMSTGAGTEQLSLFLGRDCVLTFQERPGDCFDPVRERIRKAGGRLRHAGPDYLTYALLDAVVDDYFPVLEKHGEQLEALENAVIQQPDTQLIARIHEVKRNLLIFRRAIWPLREAISSLFRESVHFIHDETRLYLRDCYDHTVQIIDLLENYRDVSSSLMEVYLSSVSNRLNETMKVLTIFMAVFAPLTFIAGIYGMNFHTEKSPWNMPELTWYLGYPFAITIMLAVTIVMLLYFRSKGWLGRGKTEAKQGTGDDV